MSSETSTKPAKVRRQPDTANVRLKPDTTYGTETDATGVRPQPDRDPGLQAWQFFVLAGLGCATVVVFLARGRGITPILLLSLVIAATAVVGMAALRTLKPLVSPEDDRTVMYGHRTRVALEREKTLALRSIKELEFDRAMGKLSDADWREMSGRLRARAARLMRQLDAGAGYREQIERDLAKRLGDVAIPRGVPTCIVCQTVNDPDAKFCKGCGNKL